MTLTNQTAPPPAFIDSRTGTHPGYDRVTFEFNNGRTGTIQLLRRRIRNHRDPRGDTVTLAGKFGICKIKGADNHTAFSGSTDIKNPAYPGILEVRELGDFEGTVQGPGTPSSPCHRAYLLTSPTRLVIDIQTS